MTSAGSGQTPPPPDPGTPRAAPAAGGVSTTPVDAVSTAPRWSVNPAVAYGAAGGVVLLALALVFGSPVLALLAVPLVFALASGIGRRPTRDAAVTVQTVLDADDDGRGVGYRTSLDIANAAAGDVEAVAVSLVAADDRVHRFAVDAATARSFAGRIPVAHSGPQEIVRFHWSAFAASGSSISSPELGPVSRRLIPPPRLKIESLPLPLRVIGITGAHGSRQPGDGGEFRDIALFAPGDRLRRIDWKATARRAQRFDGVTPGELYVRRSFSTADALVVLVLDDRDDLGADVTSWSGAEGRSPTATSLDLGREAAASLATAYLDAGDRVALRDLAGTAKPVEPGGGRRHLDRLRSAIATAAPTGEPGRSVRTPLVPPTALVVVLSTFLDEQAASMATHWASIGHRVIAVDVLPQPSLVNANREQKAALRVLLLERTMRLDTMAAVGVETVRWQPGPGDSAAAVQLRLLTRPRRFGGGVSAGAGGRP